VICHEYNKGYNKMNGESHENALFMVISYDNPLLKTESYHCILGILRKI
jgi:hypothetical protein